MEIKIHNKRTIVELIVIAAVIFWGINHLETVKAALSYVIGILTPVIAGCVVAFVLNVPMRFMEKQIKRHFHGSQSLIRVLAIVLSLLCVILCIVFVFATIIPELINTASVMNKGLPKVIDGINVWLNEFSKEYPQFAEYLGQLELNWSEIAESVMGFLKNGVSNIVASTWGVATSVIGTVSSIAIGFIIGIYILLRKEILCLQAKKLVYAYLPEQAVKVILKIVKLSNKTFSSFISSQCMEAVIFGTLTYITMLIFRFPYASSISVLIGFTTLIPVVGAFVGTALGAVLILVESPIQAVWFVVMIMVLQQIDGNLIYPRVVGTSVGLPGMWVLIAVTLGGSLMGVVGMLIFVPLFSVIYQLLGEHVNGELQKKHISEEQLRTHT